MPLITNIGRYQILDKIGQGGMGVVYRAQDTLLERIVALKVISASIEEKPQLRDRFFREARAAGQLSHPNIITIHDLGEHEGQPYLAMEFLTGQDLQHKLSGRVPMDLGRKLEIAMALCDALSYAHRRNVVHRDIKPANIFITDTGGVKILDFGLARMVTSELTGSNMMLGTLNYMAPEQVRGERTDHRADIFSFGVVLYELLGGRKAFEGDSYATTIYKILQEVPEPLRNLDASLPPEIIAIVERALAKSRDDRYQDLGDVSRDLAAFRSQLAPHALAGPVTPIPRPLSDPPVAARTPLPSLPSAAPRTSGSALSDPSAPTVLAEAWRGPGSGATSPPSSDVPPVTKTGGRGGLLLAGGIVIALIGVGAAWWATHRDTNPLSDTATRVSPQTPPPSAPTAAPQQTPPPAADEGNVDEARSRMARAKAGARDAGPAALNSPVYGAASAAEREATRLQQAGRPVEAAAKFYEASGLYQSAELTARTRSTPFGRSGQAPSAPAQSEGRGSPAAPTVQPPAPKPAETPPPVQQDPPPIVPPPPPPQPKPTPTPVATNPPPASPATTVVPAAPPQLEPVPAETGVRELVHRYEQALESRNINALKQLWPSLQGPQEDALRQEFTHARQIAVEVGSVDISASGNTATATFLRRYELVTVEGQRLLHNNRTIISARRAGGDWLIERVRFEAVR